MNTFTQRLQSILGFAGQLGRTAGALSIEPLCHVLAAFGIAMIVEMLAYPIAVSCFGSPAAGFLLPLFTFFAGWLLQAVFLAAIGQKKRDDFSYEGFTRYFKVKYLLPLLPVLYLLCQALGGIIDRIRGGFIAGQDADSLVPVLYSMVLFLPAVAGAVTQFYPYTRLMSLRAVLTALGISFMIFVWLRPVFVGIFFILYMICAVLIMNQSYIMRIYNGVAVTKITPSARYYNIRMILLALVIAAAFGGILYIFVNGAWLILELLFYLILYHIVGMNSADRHTLQQNVSGDFAAITDGSFADLSILGFILIGISLIVFIVFGRTVEFRRFFAWLRRLLDDFMAMFMGSGDIDYARQGIDINYRDTTEKLGRVPSGARSRALEHKRFTARDFRSELALRRTDSEKLTYSYLVMIELLGRMNLNLKESDTPRQLSRKIAGGMQFDSIHAITDLIERIKYAERAASPEESAAVLECVVEMVEKHLAV